MRAVTFQLHFSISVYRIVSVFNFRMALSKESSRDRPQHGIDIGKMRLMSTLYICLYFSFVHFEKCVCWKFACVNHHPHRNTNFTVWKECMTIGIKMFVLTLFLFFLFFRPSFSSSSHSDFFSMEMLRTPNRSVCAWAAW